MTGAARRARTVRLADESATCALGRMIAPALRAGDRVLLSGALGTGKTCFARAVIGALTVTDAAVTSPSFNLVHCHEGRHFPIVHADLYRLNRPQEMEELGLDDDGDSLQLIEWPERAPGRFGADSLWLRLEFDGTGRTATFSGGGTWNDRLRILD